MKQVLRTIVVALSGLLFHTVGLAQPPAFLVYELPTNAIPEWTDLNNRCEVVGYSLDLSTSPIFYQGEGVLFDLADPLAGAVKLGYLTAGGNWHYSHVLDINNNGRMVGRSNDATTNRQRPVEFLRPAGSGVTTLTAYSGNGTGIHAINTSGDRMLIINPPDTYLYDPTNNISYALHGGSDVFGSAAMNDMGQVAIHVQEASGHKVYLCEVQGGVLQKTELSALSGALGSYGIEIHAINDGQVIVGTRTIGGVYYPFIYDVMNDRLVHTATAGGYFYDVNEEGWVVGTRYSKAVIGRLTTNDTVTVYDLDNHLVSEASGYTLSEAKVINDQGIILVKINGGSHPWGLLIPEGLVPVTGTYHTSIGAGAAGGVDVTISNVTTTGTASNTYDQTMKAADWDAAHDGFFEALHPSAPTNLPLQSWQVTFSGAFTGEAEVTVDYDESRLPGDESVLGILHYDGASWQTLPGQVDAAANTYTFRTPSLSPFVLTVTNAGPATRVIRLAGDLAFGTVDIGTGAQHNLAIYNDGNADLTVSSNSYPAGFSGAWSGTIASGSSQLVAVTFTPLAATTYSGSVTVHSDKTSGTDTWPISGTGVQPPISNRIIRLAGNLAFGNVEIGANTQRNLAIYNDGNADLTVSSNSYPAGFSGTWGGAIASGSSQLVAVTFAPLAATTYSGMVTVHSDKTSGTDTLPVSGTGIVPANPVPILYAPTGTVAEVSPTFAWSSVTDATWYLLVINRNNTLYSKRWVQGTNSWEATFTFAAGNYTWWARAWSAANGYSDWSQAATFTRVNLAPGAPVAVTPAGTIDTNRPAFAWSAVDHADWYTLSLQRGGKSYATKWVNGVTNWTPDTSLLMGTYTWWVRGWNAVDGLGAWSAQQDFSYGAVQPLTPTGAVTWTRQPMFSWTAAPGASWYYLYLSRDGVKYSTQWIQNATNGLAQTTLAAGAYRWWIRPWNAQGYGDWSAAADFTIPYAIPQTIVPISPSGTAAAPSVAYSWEADPAATWYNIWIGANGSTWVQTWYSTGSTTGVVSKTVNGHVAGTAYSWYVRGWGPDGFGEWSTETQFTAQ